MEWTELPKRERQSGFGTKLKICVGCEGYITLGGIILIFVYLERLGMSWILFITLWQAIPPIVHKGGKPFRTRLVRSTLGLQYPPAMTKFPFICEACTVRAVLGRELTWTPGNIQLLMLERVCLIDMVHAWA
jgi:hypothetical protein